MIDEMLATATTGTTPEDALEKAVAAYLAAAAELMAYRIAVVMAGGRIDWSVTDFPSIADFIGGASAPLIITCNQEVQP